MALMMLQSTNMPFGSYCWESTKTRKATSLVHVKTSNSRTWTFSSSYGVNYWDMMVHGTSQSLQSKLGRGTPVKCVKGSQMTSPRRIFEGFTEEAIKVIQLSEVEAWIFGKDRPELNLLKLIGERAEIGHMILSLLGINLKDAHIEKLSGLRVLILLPEEARLFGHGGIANEDLVLGLVPEGVGFAKYALEYTRLRRPPIKKEKEKVRAGRSTIGRQARFAVTRIVGGEMVEAGFRSSCNKQLSLLDQYGTDLTKLAEEGKLDPPDVGIRGMIRRVSFGLAMPYIYNLNPCLIYEHITEVMPIVEGVAQRIAAGCVPNIVRDKKVIMLDMQRLASSSRCRDEFEERIKKILEEIKESSQIILYINELKSLRFVGCDLYWSGVFDPSIYLRAALDGGELQCIVAASVWEYENVVRKDSMLWKRLAPFDLNKPPFDFSRAQI